MVWPSLEKRAACKTPSREAMVVYWATGWLCLKKKGTEPSASVSAAAIALAIVFGGGVADCGTTCAGASAAPEEFEPDIARRLKTIVGTFRKAGVDEALERRRGQRLTFGERL